MRLEFESALGVSPERAWAWATSVEGVSSELSPVLRMTAPKGFVGIDPAKPSLGKPLFRSWVLLFGIIPIDSSELTIIEFEAGRRFLEQSPMWSMKLWRHERIIEPRGSGCVIRDRLEFRPRFGDTLTTWFLRRVFHHRHSVLRRAMGGAERNRA